MKQITEKYTSYAMKNTWGDYVKNVRELTVKKSVGEIINDYIDFAENTEFCVVNSSNENEKTFSKDDYLAENDGLSRVEIFKEIKELHILENYVATGKYLISYKPDKENPEKRVEVKTAEMIIKDRFVKIIY